MQAWTNGFAGPAADRDRIVEQVTDLGDVLDRLTGATWRTLTVSTCRRTVEDPWTVDMRTEDV
jgi:hypothetical protein